MKKYSFYYLFFLLAGSVVAFSGCGKDDEGDPPAHIAVTSVTISPSEDFSLNVNETKQLAAVVTPETATDKTVVWESASPGVATVANGLVTAVSAGTARITATAGGRSASLNVTVTDSLTQGWVSSSGQWGYPATAFAETGDMPKGSPYIHLSFSENQCSGATLNVMFTEGTYLGSYVNVIDPVFPEATTISPENVWNQVTVDLLKVGVERLFEGKTIGEIQQWAQGNMQAILDNWWAALQLCNTLHTNNDWEIARFSYFNSTANGHIDYLLLDMDRMGITETEVEDQQMVPTACQLELFFNNVTGKCEEAYVYMKFAHPDGGLDFAANYIKPGISYNDDVAGTQARGENLEIPLHEISNNFFSGKTRAEMIGTAKDEIIRNVLNLCIK